MQSGSCSLAVSSMAYAGADAPSLPLDAGPAIVHVAVKHAGQFATNVHPVRSHMAQTVTRIPGQDDCIFTCIMPQKRLMQVKRHSRLSR